MEEERFKQLIATHQQALLVLAFQYCGNRSDAEDIVQEVFVKLYTSPPATDSDEALRYWLIRVTINRCKDFLRAPWHRLRASFETAEQVLSDPYPEDTGVFEAVMQLPQKYREVVMLYYYEDLPVQRIATLLQRKPSTVQTQLLRARALLKQESKEVWEDEAP